jgi:hypothetical protein
MISWGLFIAFVQEHDSHRLGRPKASKSDLEKSPSPSPVFVQVFISMGLRLTICASYASGGFIALFVGEEKTPSGQSVAQSAISTKAGDRRGRRGAEVWFRVNMWDYNQEVLIRQLLFTI